jgi:hypothetical protein
MHVALAQLSTNLEQLGQLEFIRIAAPLDHWMNFALRAARTRLDPRALRSKDFICE